MCQPQRDRCPPSQELRSGFSRGHGAGCPAAGSSGLGWLCHGGVPLSPLQTFCTQGLEKVVVVARVQGTTWGAEEGAACGLLQVPMAPRTVPITPPCCHPLSKPRFPSLGAARRRQGGKSLRAGCSQVGVVAGAAGHPLVTSSWGVWEGSQPPHLWFWAPRAVWGLTLLPGWGGWGAPQGDSTQVLARLGLPSCWVGTMGTLPVPPGPQYPYKGL